MSDPGQGPVGAAGRGASWIHRGGCLFCAHVRGRGGALQCAHPALPMPTDNFRARDPGQPCGPGAALWEPR